MKTSEKNTWKFLTQSFTRDLHNVLLQQHDAAQPIALAGKHLIHPQPDDSHTNMEYLADREWLIGNELPNGLRVGLQLTDLKLFIIDQEMKYRTELPLAGLNKQQIFDQMKQITPVFWDSDHYFWEWIIKNDLALLSPTQSLGRLRNNRHLQKKYQIITRALVYKIKSILSKKTTEPRHYSIG